MTVAVVGGSGKTGRAIRAALEKRNVPSVSIGRAEWPDLAGALAETERTYVLAPNMHENERSFVLDVVAAARAAGVERLVYHSVASPYVPAMPHHLGKAESEDVVRRSGLDWTILQPGAYLQNFPLDGSPLRIAYRADAPFGFSHLDDVAEVAATVLLDDGHEGATYELASVRSTPAGIAAATGAELDVITPEEWARTDGAGLDERVRQWLLAMFAYYDDHGLPVGTLPMTTLLGHAPRTLTS